MTFLVLLRKSRYKKQIVKMYHTLRKLKIVQLQLQSSNVIHYCLKYHKHYQHSPLWGQIKGFRPQDLFHFILIIFM